MQLARPTYGTQSLPRLRGDAPATDLPLREVGMKSRPLDACPGCGRDGRGAISAGRCVRGSFSLQGEDRRRRFGTEQRWLGRFSDPRGSSCLERMYYDRASSSSLFRTNFLNCLSGVAGDSEAHRSHSRDDTAYTVPTAQKSRSYQQERDSGRCVRSLPWSLTQGRELACRSCRRGTKGSELIA